LFRNAFDARMAEETKNPAEETETVAEATAEAPTEVVEVKKAEEIVPGMVVRVHQKIKEGSGKEERERVQIFEGTVIAVKGKDAVSRTITVRKVTLGVGVERIFPVRSSAIAKIEVVKRFQVKRAKLYFLRDTTKKLRKEVKK
jgi:large subunit ribosomal protein L19